jgi:hypothetical protein
VHGGFRRRPRVCVPAREPPPEVKLGRGGSPRAARGESRA